MKQETSNAPIAADLLVVMRAMARSNMSTSSVLSEMAGLSVLMTLPTLIARGYAKEHTGRQRDGRSTSLFSLTTEGEAALKAAAQAHPVSHFGAVAPARTEGPSAAIYQGNELRPYAGRAGALAAFAHPSRVGAYLHHPDGSITPIK